MNVICESGLFIGVTRHMGLPPAEHLPSAKKDALTLRDYFDAALPDGTWSAEVGARTPPKRVDILEALHTFCHDLPARAGGVILFSGHATSTETGLLLKPYDSHEGFPHDTGLSLARVLRVLKAQASAEKQFFLILDCCRDGLGGALADDLPANVCVLYACAQGAPAVATSDYGVLTHSLIDSMNAIAAESGAGTCSVAALCNRLSRQIFHWRPALALQCELVGSGADRMLLPLVCPPADRRTAPMARCCVRYSFGTEDELNEGFRSLAAAIFAWYGIEVDSEGGQQFVRSQLVAGTHDDVLRLDVQLPPPCAHWTTAAFLAHILSVPVGDSQILILNWHKPMAFSSFNPVQHVVHQGEWTHGASDYRLAWKNAANGAEYRGVATLTEEAGGAQLYISCETLDCYDMPLRHLMPTVPDLLELFRSLS